MAMAKFGLNWLSSTVFKNAGQNQSQIDRFRSAFRLTQERKEKFLPALDRPYQALQENKGASAFERFDGVPFSAY
ncbi:hypothetical protein [Ligilactobacillus ruminis]|uniref:hypothetical protein n=1 Tax=Ligilactobacillus ruminis TaxID=1623 RepID=UPI0022E71104|nr:hypothetical protein [Ligilactobacillus ruminis]